MFKKKILISLFATVLIMCGTHKQVQAQTILFESNMKNCLEFIAEEINEFSENITVYVREFNSDDLYYVLSLNGVANSKVEFDYSYYNLAYYSYSVTDTSAGYKKVSINLTYRQSTEETEYSLIKAREVLRDNSYVLGLTDEQKYRWAYNYVINLVEYDYTFTNNTEYRGWVDGKTICGGYSSIYYTLVKELGLECRIVYGDTPGGYHAWNVVKLDGKWYYIDTTWGDTSGYDLKYYFELAAKSKISTHALRGEFKELFEFGVEDYTYKMDNQEYTPLPYDFADFKEIDVVIKMGEAETPKHTLTWSLAKFEKAIEDSDVCEFDGNVIKPKSIGKTKVYVKDQDYKVNYTINVKVVN